MRDFAKWVIAATVSASALACLGAGAASAADVQVPYGEPRYSQPRQPPPEYYPPEEERYGYRQAPPAHVYREAPPAYVYREAPPAYVHPAPPPPPSYRAYRYYDEHDVPPAIAIVPPPYYKHPYYYKHRHYGYRWDGPRIAREYGHYPRPWRHRDW